MSFRLTAQLGIQSRLATLAFKRSIHLTSKRLATGNLFGDITDATVPETKKPKKKDMSDALSDQTDAPVDKSKITVAKDKRLQEFIGHEPTLAIDKYLSPLKQAIYKANVAKNGFFKNSDEVKLEDGERYSLKLTQQQIEAFEPSIYVKSFRIKSSPKKATLVLKLINRLNVKVAITQCHFNQKKIAQEIGTLLEKGLKESTQLGLNEDELFIDQIWVGKDGKIVKRVDIKARGRNGIIEHPYVHVKAILKGSQTKKRLAYEQEKKDAKKKPYIQLPSDAIRGKPQGFYRW